jgi:hypothetical protein
MFLSSSLRGEDGTSVGMSSSSPPFKKPTSTRQGLLQHTVSNQQH